jgi:hypothetical protein
MPNELYKNHVLVCTASYNSENRCWVASVSVSCRAGGGFQFHPFSVSDSKCLTAEEAIIHGFQKARAWVEGRYSQELQSGL